MSIACGDTVKSFVTGKCLICDELLIELKNEGSLYWNIGAISRVPIKEFSTPAPLFRKLEEEYKEIRTTFSDYKLIILTFYSLNNDSAMVTILPLLFKKNFPLPDGFSNFLSQCIDSLRNLSSFYDKWVEFRASTGHIFYFPLRKECIFFLTR